MLEAVYLIVNERERALLLACAAARRLSRRPDVAIQAARRGMPPRRVGRRGYPVRAPEHRAA